MTCYLLREIRFLETIKLALDKGLPKSIQQILSKQKSKLK